MDRDGQRWTERSVRVWATRIEQKGEINVQRYDESNVNRITDEIELE
jgi:hypothetical protein